MKSYSLILLFCLFTLLLSPFTSTRAQGVVFADKPLDEVMDQAKAEGKMVFVDCYATWCPPCKKMLLEEFPKQEMGDYLNTSFVCAKYNLDDEPYKELAQRWDVHAFPTFVFLNNDGELLYRMVGYRQATKFIEEARKGIADNTFGHLKKQYDEGDRSLEFLRSYLTELERMGKMRDAREVALQMLSTDSSISLSDSVVFNAFCRYVRDPYDSLFLQQWQKRDALTAVYGERATKKFNDVWGQYLGHFAIVEERNLIGYDWDRVKEYEQYMEQQGVKNHAQLVQQLHDSWEMYKKLEKQAK